MADIIQDNIEECDFDYTLLCKTQDDILNDLGLCTEEKIGVGLIIDFVEETIADKLSQGLAVSLPHVGVFQQDGARMNIRNHSDEIRDARKTMDRESYREYLKKLHREEKANIAEKESSRKTFKTVIARNRKTYNKKFNRHGKIYADMWILSILLCKPIEYNIEIEEQYERLKD